MLLKMEEIEIWPAGELLARCRVTELASSHHWSSIWLITLSKPRCC
jgi:hypothetical protein